MADAEGDKKAKEPKKDKTIASKPRSRATGSGTSKPSDKSSSSSKPKESSSGSKTLKAVTEKPKPTDSGSAAASGEEKAPLASGSPLSSSKGASGGTRTLKPVTSSGSASKPATPPATGTLKPAGAGARPGGRPTAAAVKPGKADTFQTLKLDASTTNLQEDLTLHQDSEHLVDVNNVISVAKITQLHLMQGHQSILPLYKHFNTLLKEERSHIYKPNLVLFNFPKGVPQFENLPPKLYDIKRLMPVGKVLENILRKYQMNPNMFSLSTLGGIIIPENHCLANYGLGSLLKNWELNIVKKQGGGPDGTKPTPQFGTLMRSVKPTDLQENQELSLLIVCDYEESVSKLQRLFIMPKHSVSHINDALIERLKKDHPEATLNPSDFEFKDFDNVPLDPQKKFSEYGVGGCLDRWHIKLCRKPGAPPLADGSSALQQQLAIQRARGTKNAQQQLSDLVKFLSTKIEEVEAELEETKDAHALALETQEKNARRHKMLRDHQTQENEKLKLELEQANKEIQALKKALESRDEQIQSMVAAKKEDNEAGSVEGLKAEIEQLKHDIAKEKERTSQVDDLTEQIQFQKEQMAGLQDKITKLKESRDFAEKYAVGLEEQIEEMKQEAEQIQERANERESLITETLLEENTTQVDPTSLTPIEPSEEVDSQEATPNPSEPTTPPSEPATPSEPETPPETATPPAEPEPEAADPEPEATKPKEPEKPTKVVLTEAQEANAAEDAAEIAQVEAEGLLTQWAWKVVAFSSEATSTDWAAKNILGSPKVSSYGDSEFTWAPLETNGGHEWITLKFKRKVNVRLLKVLESCNPGSVCKIEVQIGDAFETMWETEPKELPHELNLIQASVAKGKEFVSNVVKIHLNTKDVYDEWNEIAAVQMIGLPLPGEEDEASDEEPEEKPAAGAMKRGKPPPPPPMTVNAIKSAVPQKPVVKVAPKSTSGSSTSEFAQNLLAEITGAKGVLKKVDYKEDRAFQKKKQDDGSADLLATLQKHFAAFHAEDLEDDWDDKDGDINDAEWEDDDNDRI